jgi:hypothetical protein
MCKMLSAKHFHSIMCKILSFKHIQSFMCKILSFKHIQSFSFNHLQLFMCKRLSFKLRTRCLYILLPAVLRSPCTAFPIFPLVIYFFLQPPPALGFWILVLG